MVVYYFNIFKINNTLASKKEENDNRMSHERSVYLIKY